MSPIRTIFSGTFDPFTNGHKAVVDTALNLGMEIIILFAINPNKSRMFPIQTMMEAVQKSFDRNVRVEKWEGQISDYCYQCGVDTIIRGVRNESDFTYEKQMADYHSSFHGFPTLFIPTTTFITSSMIRELYKSNSEIVGCPPEIIELLNTLRVVK